MADDLIEMTSMEKIFIANEGINGIAYTGEELLRMVKAVQVNVKQVCYLDILKMRQCYLAQKIEVEKIQFLLNSLKRNKLTEFQQAQIKSLHRKLLNINTVQQQVSFLLDSLEEVTLEKEADKEVIELAKNTIEKFVAEQRESSYERQLWQNNKVATTKETKVNSRIMCLHCPKCKQPMACLIYIDGDSIHDIEYTAEMMAEHIRGFGIETWIVASPLEIDDSKEEQALLSYVMRSWPQKSNPEKMLSTVFSRTVLNQIAEQHC